MIAEKDKCKECLGKKVTQENKILEVHVDKGMTNGQKIPFRGEGDQMVILSKLYIASQSWSLLLIAW